MRGRDVLWIPRPKGHALVAEDPKGRIVGVTAYSMTPEGYAYGTAHEVHPDFRGRGIGDRLHGERLQDAKARGATHFVGATNDPAMAPVERVIVLGLSHAPCPWSLGPSPWIA